MIRKRIGTTSITVPKYNCNNANNQHFTASVANHGKTYEKR